jgi:endonuclease YncB( thermonuclease family)
MSDIQVIPVRIKILGPQFWQCIVEDAETGRRLPVMVDGDAFTLRVENGAWIAHVRLLIHEVDALVSAQIEEQIERISPEEAAGLEARSEEWGLIVRRPLTEAPSETVDDFAARTVSLIMEPKCPSST